MAEVSCLLELAASIGFYIAWKISEKKLHRIKSATDINIDDLKKLPSTTTTIDYAAITGVIRQDDKQLLQSDYKPTTIGGVIQHILVEEHKREKTTSITETKQTVQNFFRQIPFRLVSFKNNKSYVRINDPLSFECIRRELETIYQHYQPKTLSSPETIIQTLQGQSVAMTC
ncbi:unnamed protein product, partial [Didymodactylos carnosus]